MLFPCQSSVRRILFPLILLACFFPSAHAAASFDVAGWIPYWSVSGGTRDAKKHLDVLSMIHPFGFSVKTDGTLEDLAGLKKSAWQKLFKSARTDEVAIIPTVMWTDSAAIHKTLSDPALRKKHIQTIVAMVKKGKYDGVDIDYERKLTATKESFSLFLEELKVALGDKILTCAIEARTPPESLYTIVPASVEYANDLIRIGRACDRVAIMAYDQRRADLTLNNARKGMPYMPVADIDWVRKVGTLMAQSIPKEKLMLGIPTYGHVYDVTVLPEWYKDYTRIKALNPDDALDLADEHKVTPSHNAAGEAYISFWPDGTPSAQKKIAVPKNTSPGNKVAAQALASANATGVATQFTFVTWNDAEAIKEKIDLARELGFAGVALFKIDGEEDRDAWKELE